MLRIRDLERFNKLHAGEIIKLPGYGRSAPSSY